MFVYLYDVMCAMRSCYPVYLNLVTGELTHVSGGFEYTYPWEHVYNGEPDETNVLIPHISREQRENAMLAYAEEVFGGEWRVKRAIMEAHEKDFAEFDRVFFSYADDATHELYDWHCFEEDQYLLIAKEWCEANDIPYTMKMRGGKVQDLSNLADVCHRYKQKKFDIKEFQSRIITAAVPDKLSKAFRKALADVNNELERIIFCEPASLREERGALAADKLIQEIVLENQKLSPK